MGIVRAESMMRMRVAFRAGMSHAGFVRQEKKAGRETLRKTISLGDWRTVNEIEKKKGLLRFVRRDRYPTDVQVAKSWQKLSKEYMYVVKLRTVLKLGEPFIEHTINILSDVPMTPAMIEAEILDRWTELQESAPGELVKIQVWSAIRRVME